MNKIEFPRKGVDGIDRTKDDIESFWLEVEDDIKKNVKKLRPRKPIEKDVKKDIIDNIKDILCLNPTEIMDVINGKKYSSFKKMADDPAENKFRKKILNAFGYTRYRKSNRLSILANMLNVKVCPYCNMHYTLYAEKEKKKLTRFQFDHFISKIDYPMFSMTLYNLIPSCGVCNQGKSQGNLPIEFNPYHSNIHEQFNFRLDNPIEMYLGEKISDDIAVLLSPKPNIQQTDVDQFDKVFHLSTLYRRAGDVAQEVFDKVYCDPYYSKSSNFTFLGQEEQYLERLYMGTYTDPKDIEKRPMTKFVQDMREQAFDKIQNGFLPNGNRRF